MMAHSNSRIAPKDLYFGSSSMYYIKAMQRYSCSKNHYAFKEPALPPWRVIKNKKNITIKLLNKSTCLPKEVHLFVVPVGIPINTRRFKDKNSSKVTKLYFDEKKKPSKITEAIEIIKQIDNINEDHIKGIQKIQNNKDLPRITEICNSLAYIDILLNNHDNPFNSKQPDEDSFINQDFIFTKVLTHKLLVCLMKCLNCKTISELKNIDITDSQWDKVTRKLRIPFDHTKKYWYHKLHMQLFCPGPIKMTDIISRFIVHLYESRNHPVNWGTALSTKFDGFTLQFLAIMYDFLINFAKKQLKIQRDHEKCINYLHEHHLDVVRKTKSTWILPRLDHILRRKDPVPKENKKHGIIDTLDVIKLYSRSF